MSRRCALTGKGVHYGNQVSHSNRKTSKRFLPNLQEVSLLSDTLKRTIRMRIAVNTLRSIEVNGGLDKFLLSTANSKLTTEALTLKKKIKKALEEAAA
jgi:large subunit ribosomal protein L28